MAAALAWPATASAQTNDAHSANQARVDALDTSNRAAHSDNANILVLPG